VQTAKTVLQVWVHGDTLMDLAGKGGQVSTTEDHPFWSVTDGRFERADELARGEKVLTASGLPLQVGGIVPGSAHWAKAYNLTVADAHTYFVMAGEKSILVHNGGGLDDDINLYGDYTARADQYNAAGGQADLEIHVYYKGSEVGLYGSSGFFNKHTLKAVDVEVPRQVHNRLKGITVDWMRRAGRLAPDADIKGDSWKRPMVNSNRLGGC